MASPLDGYVSLLDRQRLQQEFEAKKQARALQLAATLQELNAPAISAKDMMAFQLQSQNMQQQAQDRALDRESRMDMLREGAQNKRDMMQEKLDEKKNQKRMVDQNLLTGSFDALDKQLMNLDKVFGKPNEKGEYYSPPEGLSGNYGVMGQLPSWPGGDASDIAEKLKQVSAEGFIGSIQQMKNQSATGASGLGSMTEREGDKVQAAAAALGNSQSLESALQNATQYRAELLQAKKRLQEGFINIYGGSNASSSRPTPERAAEILRQRAAARAGQ